MPSSRVCDSTKTGTNGGETECAETVVSGELSQNSASLADARHGDYGKTRNFINQAGGFSSHIGSTLE